MLSPHGSSSGVYRSVDGDLHGFGVDGIEIEGSVDVAAAEEISAAWGKPLLDAPADHGIVVPLVAGSVPEAPVVACTLTEVTGPQGVPVQHALAEARDLAATVQKVSADRTVLFVASAHTSAALTPQGPLTLRESGVELDKQIREAMSADVGRLDAIAPELWASGGACGAGPLTALGCLFGGSTANVAWYDHPFGVGYMLALVA
jgi:hypothetical protein